MEVFLNVPLNSGLLVRALDCLRRAMRGDEPLRYSGQTSWRGLVSGVETNQAHGVVESWGPGQRFGVVPVGVTRFIGSPWRMLRLAGGTGAIHAPNCGGDLPDGTRRLTDFSPRQRRVRSRARIFLIGRRLIVGLTHEQFFWETLRIQRSAAGVQASYSASF